MLDQETVSTLEWGMEKAIATTIVRLGLKELSLLPAEATMRQMAKAAVAMYEAEMDTRERPTAG